MNQSGGQGDQGGGGPPEPGVSPYGPTMHQSTPLGASGSVQAQSADGWSMPGQGDGLDLERDRVRALLQQRMFGASDGPVTVGRFQIVQRLGAGSAGVVYQAHDPQLNRPVALKLLHAIHHETQRYTDRLVREAQAMAQLTHPNVVVVHDVGTHEGQLFIAMEFVEGSTLRQWLEGAQHSWQRVLEVLLGAGRGLEAAHQRGLVHRDFKPENTLIDGQGRARIVDFGLVRAATEVAAQAPGASHPHAASPLGMPMTQTGALVGTPLYMSPEQLEGRVADARSDQFGFCATLFEALYGNRPYEGGSIGELALVVSEGRVSPPQHDPGVPPVVHQALLRGVRPQPEARYPSMTELLADLEKGIAPRRKPGLVVGLIMGAVVALSVLGVGGWWALSRYGGGAGPSAEEERNAPEAVEVRKLMEAQRYKECVEVAHKAPTNRFVISTWLSCALGLQDYQEAGRACDAWRKHFDVAMLPDACDPNNLKLYEAVHRRDFRECLRITESMEPKAQVLAYRLNCASSAPDWKAYEKTCALLRKKFPQNPSAKSCLKILEGVPR